MTEGGTGKTDPEGVDRAARLFEFLARVQQLTSRAPRTVDSYEKVVWLHGLPDHSAVQSVHRAVQPDPLSPILTVERAPRVPPPDPGERLQPWVIGPLDDPNQPPVLREHLVVEPDDPEDSSTLDPLEDHPEVVSAFQAWQGDWARWAEKDRHDQLARDCYGDLFSLYVSSTNNPEEFELVAAAGCLSWVPPVGDPVKRHLLAVACHIDFDDDSGRLTVLPVEGTISVETDMLDPEVIKDPKRIHDVEQAAQETERHPLGHDVIEELSRRLVFTLDASGQYDDDDEPAPQGPEARGTYAPALILRKRSTRGLIGVLKTIAQRLRDGQELPQGLVPLVDPNYTPDADLGWVDAEGALIPVDDELFLPLPVNERQMQVVRRVDTAAQILVQGPPGTGKTHTAAALISHLLAQGRRILVTAQTDRALKEVRTKLPDAIKPLSVSVVGASREDMSELKVAVERIGQEAAEYDAAASTTTIDHALSRIDALRRERAQLHYELIEARTRDTRVHDVFGYQGTLAVIAQHLDAQVAEFDWLTDITTITNSMAAPVTAGELAEWRALLLDPGLAAQAEEASRRLIDPSALVAPETFAVLVRAEADAIAALQRFSAYVDHDSFPSVQAIARTHRADLKARLGTVADEADSLAARPEPWLATALDDIRSGRTSIWRDRHAQITELIARAQPALAIVGPVEDIHSPLDDLGRRVALAHAVRDHLIAGGKLKVDAAGRPRIGAFSNSVLKQSSDLFDQVQVSGRPPASVEQLDRFLAWADAIQTLDTLDRAWPAGTRIPPEDTIRERLQWHSSELDLLRRVLRFADDIERERSALREAGLNPPEWHQFSDVRGFCWFFDAADAADDHRTASIPLEQLTQVVESVSKWDDAALAVRELDQGLAGRDWQAYANAHRRLVDLDGARVLLGRRAAIAKRISSSAPALLEAIGLTPEDPVWEERVGHFDSAWHWAQARAWVTDQQGADVNALQRSVTRVEHEIRVYVEQVAATRAWVHAVSPERITGQARADLEHYALLVRKLGAGKSKYAEQKRSDVRDAMERCRPTVPVWIMPIYRIAEQMRVEPDMFDVVIVDEASQAGLEATFLQYLAKKIVVIGDDKQVSPAAVGVDIQQLRDLANQYLFDEVYKSLWTQPTASLFDQAKMRYGGLITLVEHRRCVPEIIGFSNRVAYEPDGVRLIPVRQYGADRLDPIKTTHLPEGYTRGSTNKINPVEVDAIVDQIEKCCADPAYDGQTFGVISLLGSTQAKAIEKALLERLTPEEWKARDLRCGDSAAFQGSERNVMFLSLVTAAEPGKRVGALTQELYVQRYNVAASRAKDQLWLFHSVTLDDLSGNPDDMRFALLDYCYGVAHRLSDDHDGVIHSAVPDDERVAPFDSLFEQRVFNRLIDRGYTVIPQYDVLGYLIDLVVVGPRSRVAIECDGDAWHGPDRYLADLARQREIERCGWEFFRLRESAYYVDPAEALEPLWELLDSLGIHPSGWVPPVEPTAPLSAEPDSTLTVEISTPIRDGAVEAFQPSEGPPVHEADPSGPEEAATIDVTELPEASRTPWLEAPPQPNPDGGTHDEPDVQQRRAEEAHAPATSASPDITASATPANEAQPTPSPQPSAESRDEPLPDVPGASAPRELEDYFEFGETTVPALEASRQQVLDGLLAIVQVEGPVLGDRLQQAYVRASGGQRVGKQIASVLNAAISAAVRDGRLIAEAPLNEQGNKPKSFRLPDQPSVRPRTLGPRTLNQVPPLELALVLRRAANRTDRSDEEALFRAVLASLGQKRLTTNASERLRQVLPLAEADD